MSFYSIYLHTGIHSLVHGTTTQIKLKLVVRYELWSEEGWERNANLKRDCAVLKSVQLHGTILCIYLYCARKIGGRMIARRVIEGRALLRGKGGGVYEIGRAYNRRAEKYR